jgi:hypothetical protein
MLTGKMDCGAEAQSVPPMKKFIVRSAVVLGMVLLAMAAAAQTGRVAPTSRAEWTRINPVTPLTAATFLHPPPADQPWVRLNMPPTADPAELRREIQEIHDAGIAGVEVGQGAFPNEEQLVALLTAANPYGIKVSLSHGPMQSPAGYSIDGDHARKSLFLGKATVNAGAAFAGPLPAPALTQGGRGAVSYKHIRAHET